MCKCVRNRNGNTGVSIRPTTRVAIYLRDGFRCVWCDRDLQGISPFGVTLDHLEPFDSGGGNSPGNLVTSCRSCNCRRGRRDWRGFAGGSRVTARVLERVNREVPRELARLFLFGVLSMDQAVRRARRSQYSE